MPGPAPETVRVALVLNGGLSLAPWMAGVTHEVDRLRRSEAGSEPASEAWQRLAEAAHCRLVVDVVAGTSAGGLNGVALAGAIARGAALPDLRRLWATRARLWRGKLLRPQAGSPISSVLDSGFLEAAVREALAAPEDGEGGGEGGGDGEANGEDDREGGGDVTLLVTGTALYSSGAEVRDARGEAFTAGDHRRVFRFQRRSTAQTWDPAVGFRADPVDDFATHVEELRLAACAAAGYPFAFEPVREPAALHALDVSGSTGPPSWLVGGAVLDSAPFRPVLDWLGDQPRVEPGERWIVYVVPTVRPGAEGFPAGRDASPPPWGSLPGRLLGLSRESDLRDDLRELRDLAQKARSFVHRPEELISSDAPGVPPDPVAVGRAMWDAYLRTRAGAVVQLFREQHGKDRLVRNRVTEEEIDAILDADLSWIPGQLAPSREMDGTQCWQWGIGAARRIACWISRDARGATGQAALDADLCAVVAETEEKLLAVQALFARAVREAAARDADVVGAPRSADDAIRDSGLTAIVLHLMEVMVELWADAREEVLEAAWARLLSVEVLSGCMSWQFADQAPLFSLYLVSPESSRAGTVLGLDDPGVATSPADRLYGTRFGHLGGFGATRFREWDEMWGRLDGALTIADALLAKADVPEDRRRCLVDALVTEILEDSGMAPEELRPAAARVASLTPGELVALSRDSHETDFDAVLDDVSRWLAGAPLLDRPAGAGWLAARRARVRGRVFRATLAFGRRWARRLVQRQVPPRT